jgi:hypothetical protein
LWLGGTRPLGVTGNSFSENKGPPLDAKSVSSCKEFFQYIQRVVLVDEVFVSETEAIEDAFWGTILTKRVDKRLPDSQRYLQS